MPPPEWHAPWKMMRVISGHLGWVRCIAVDPTNEWFVTGAADRTIKVWGLATLQPHFTLEGHEKGVNCVDYFSGGDRPYLVSGADDNTVKVWDYQTKQCVQTMDGHTHNVATVCCHPELPIIMSGSEDGCIKIW